MQTEYLTDRLDLRVLTDKDAPLVLNFYERNLEEFSEYEPIPSKEVHTVNYHAKNLEYEYNAFCQGKIIRYFMFLKENPFWIVGTLSYRNIRYGYRRNCELGYKLDKDFRHKGYMSEAINFCDDLVFSTGIHRIEAYVVPTNISSAHILEELGFEKEGLLKDKAYINGKYEDHLLYAKINEEK